MEKFDEFTIDELTVDELDAVSGGRIRWIDIHMPYKDFIKWPGGDPSPLLSRRMRIVVFMSFVCLKWHARRGKRNCARMEPTQVMLPNNRYAGIR